MQCNGRKIVSSAYQSKTVDQCIAYSGYITWLSMRNAEHNSCRVIAGWANTAAIRDVTWHSRLRRTKLHSLLKLNNWPMKVVPSASAICRPNLMSKKRSNFQTNEKSRNSLPRHPLSNVNDHQLLRLAWRIFQDLLGQLSGQSQLNLPGNNKD